MNASRNARNAGNARPNTGQAPPQATGQAPDQAPSQPHALSSWFATVRRSVRAGASTRTGVTLIAVLITMVIAVVIGYTAWRLSRRRVQTERVLKSPRRLFDTTALWLPASRAPTTRTGQEFAVSLWLYLADLQPTALGKLVLMRHPAGSGGVVATGAFGARSGSHDGATAPHGEPFQDANPLVFLDPATNKLYVCVRTTRRGSGITEPASLSDIPLIPRSSNPYVVIAVDYVPLQRWVHVVLSVQDYLVTVYLDGSIYAVENLVDGTYASSGARPMFAGTRGDIAIGSPDANISAEIRGFVANVAFMNHAPTMRQVSGIYKNGPGSSGFLASIGVDEYRVRSPIYRVGDEAPA